MNIEAQLYSEVNKNIFIIAAKPFDLFSYLPQQRRRNNPALLRLHWTPHGAESFLLVSVTTSCD